MKFTFVALIIGFLAISPVAMAAQKAISEASIKAAYKTQVAAIDKEITTLTAENNAALNKPVLFKQAKGAYVADYGEPDFKVMTNNSRINQLNEDKHVLELAYKLVSASFK